MTQLHTPTPSQETVAHAPSPLDSTVAFALTIALLLRLKKSKLQSEQETPELDVALSALFAIVALQHKRESPDLSTSYQDRVANALSLSLEVTAGRLCSPKIPFPQNVVTYLAYHCLEENPTVKLPVFQDSVPELEPTDKVMLAQGELRDQLSTNTKPFKPFPPRDRKGFVIALQELLAAAEVAGRQILYHSSFPAHFAAQVGKKRLFEVTPYLTEYAQRIGIRLPQDYHYLADILAEAETPEPGPASRLLRGVEWLRQQAQEVTIILPKDTEIKWKGFQVDMVEVAYALCDAGLIESRSARLSREQLVASFGALFGEQVENPRNHITRRLNQSTKSQMPALDKLQAAYQAMIKAHEGARLRA